MKLFPIFKKHLILLVVFLLGAMSSSNLYAQTGSIAIEDSLLNKFSIEDLVKLKKMLEQERQRLIEEQQKDLQRGIDLSKDFLNKKREENEKQDLILIRVAEYYIEEADAEFEDAMERYNRLYDEYEKQLEAYRAGKIKVEPKKPEFPHKNYEKPIAIYDLILKNFPESDLADDALYNKAYLLEKMNKEEAARQVYQELIDKYPEGEYTPEAYMHLAEFYFQPKLGQTREEAIRNLRKAALLYKNVIQFKDSPRYDEALYKLGWTYYRLAADNPENYTDAILYFTLVIQDIEKHRKIDPEGKYVKSNIQPEAMQYLAACFVDTVYAPDGIEKITRYLQDLGMPRFGVKVLSDMGDLYARIVDYNKSIRAYNRLLELYPDYIHAPLIGKKIADVYVLANRPEDAYRQREKVFEMYNPTSEWYAKIEQSDIPERLDVLNEAYKITEEALRGNLLYKLAQAEELEKTGGDSLAAYSEFAKLAKKYIEYFPTDKNAYEINWSLAYVLDTELGRYKEAFEEYIRVSNDYLESEHREEAANNAIAVAQTLVQLKRATVDTAQVAGMDMAQIAARDLTEEEKMLAEAYDNYIKLFPDSEKTATYLANAGALYYQHGQFDLARKYYKTMVTKFPNAQQRSIGLISLMNSYFFLGKYKDAEYVARKIVETGNLPEDQMEIAKKRIGESIYKNAERLEQEGQYLAAAQEFFRVFTEGRANEKIVDLALINSARNYEKAEEWQKAIAVYDTLVENFPNSSYRLIALGRIADAYKQIEDYKGVGRTYERIVKLYPESKDAEAALYNASIFYAKAGAWADAVRANNKYIEKYPQNPESKDLLFENARYYLKLNDLAAANRIYNDFAQNYPNDPRTIEAFYRRGEYYFERGQYNLARQEFQKAIAKSEEFARIGKDPNLYYAAEAYFKLGEIEYKEFQDIKLTYPEATLRAQLKRKKDKLLATVDAFTKVIKLGSIRGFEAMYRVAEAYEKFAEAIADQELPPNLTEDQRLVMRDKVFKAAVPAYDRAVEEYKNVIKNIPIYAEKLEISLFDTTSTKQPTTETEDSVSIVLKENIQDSTRDVALRWYNKAEEKISYILYTVAERSSEFITAYLRQKSPFTGLKYLSWKKLLLERAVAPAVKVTMEAHLKNIRISSQVGLDNKYVRESKRKILLTNNILGDQYGLLTKEAAKIYRNQVKELVKLIDAGDNATTPDGLNSLDYNEQVLTTLDYINEFLGTSLHYYQNTLKFAAENNIQNDAVLTTEERLLNLAYETGSLMLDLANEAAQNRDNYYAKSDETGDQRFQLGGVYFDDQRSTLEEYAKRTLELAYQITKDYDIKNNIWTNLILAKLIELDPAKYLGDMPKEKLIVMSDSSWFVSDSFALDWTNPDLDDSQWKKAVVVKVPADMFFSLFAAEGINPPAIWITENKPVTEMSGPDTTTIDTTRSGPRSLELEDKEILEPELATKTQPDTTVKGPATSAEPDTLVAFFRKHFRLDARPVGGHVYITADDEYHFYLNGEYIKGDDTRIFTEVDSVEFIAFSDYLKQGDNLIAIDVGDYDNVPRYGLRFYMELELLPGEVTAAAERLRKKIAESVDENRLKTVMILNKNRIIYH